MLACDGCAGAASETLFCDSFTGFCHIHETMLLSSECYLGDFVLFWSHIIAVHFVATFAERVVGDNNTETLAGWRKLFQRFQLAHLLIICAICRAWTQYFWLCTSICTLLRITGLLQHCVSKTSAVFHNKVMSEEPCVITRWHRWVIPSLLPWAELPASGPPSVRLCYRVVIAFPNIGRLPRFSFRHRS